jgi:hypothetical protein
LEGVDERRAIDENRKDRAMIMLHRMPSPETYPSTATTRCPELLSEWRTIFPEATATERDHEDWAEPAAILVAMWKRGEVRLLGPAMGYRCLGDRTPAPASRPGSPKGVMWGLFNDGDVIDFQEDVDLAWNARDKARIVQDYASSPVFLARAGRAMHVCDMERSSVEAALKSMLDSGVTEGFVKTRDKGATHLFDLDAASDRSLFSQMDTEEDDFGWMLVSREGDRKSLYVQERFEPTFEYRVIVVGDRIASGAGCIEAFTPGESLGEFFDDRMEMVRSSGEIAHRPDIAKRYVSFACEFVAAWAAEHGAECGYSLDLSIDARTGEVVPIELNPLLNLGLYANDADRIVHAMVTGVNQEIPA